MSNRRQIPAPAAQAGPLLVLDLPDGAGRARFYAQKELTPRRTRQLDILTGHMGPLMARVALAVSVANGTAVDTRDLPGEPLELTRQQAADFAELNDVAAWTYLKSIVNEDDKVIFNDKSTIDDVLDLPTPVYDAIVKHAGALLAAGRMAGFTVDSLPDDLDEADEDLPT